MRNLTHSLALNSIVTAVRSDEWSPAALFGGSDTGYWYDPSDFSTLFQDAGGTTPVTAVGQPVGLQLDKRSLLFSDAFNNSWLSYSPPSLSLTDANSYTVECWFRISAWNDNVGIFGWRGGFGLAAYGNTLKFWGVAPGTQIIDVIGTSEISALVETWVHFALVYNKSNNTKTIYINGTAKHTSAGGLSLSSASALDIGRYSWDSGSSGKNLNGSVSNFRILNGAAAYVANFTPPSASLEAVAGTVILTCGRYSANNPSVTQSGSVSGAGLNPFTGAIIGNHRTQSTTTKRPILREVGGLHYLEFDGIDDAMATAEFNWVTDKVTSVFGYLKTGTTANQLFAEFGTSGSGFAQFVTTSVLTRASNANYVGQTAECTYDGVPMDQAMVFSFIHDRAGATTADELFARMNGMDLAKSPNGQITSGNFETRQMFFGARNGTSLYFNGRDYGHFGINRLLTTTERGQLESWMAAKTGVTL